MDVRKQLLFYEFIGIGGRFQFPSGSDEAKGGYTARAFTALGLCGVALADNWNLTPIYAEVGRASGWSEERVCWVSCLIYTCEYIQHQVCNPLMWNNLQDDSVPRISRTAQLIRQYLRDTLR